MGRLDRSEHYDRLELSGNHVVAERGHRLTGLAWVQRVELAPRIRCKFVGAIKSPLRPAAGADQIDHLLGFIGAQFMPIDENGPELTGGLRLLHREHERHRGESVSDVLTDRLADLIFAALVIEYVVGDLESEAKQPAVGTQRCALGNIETSDERPDVAAGGEQGRGLRLDSQHVLLDVRVVSIPDRLLAHLARADVHHSAREDGYHLGGCRACRLLIRFGEVEVADYDGRLVTEERCNGGTAAPDRSPVDDVVMDKRGGMRQLHCNCSRNQMVQLVAAALGREQHQRGTNALSAGREQVRHRCRDHAWIRFYEVAEARLDHLEVSRDRPEDAYALSSSQSRTSCASIASPNRFAATSWNRCGTAVTNTSWGGGTPAAARRRE